ncbi:hypothetical protein E4U53_007133 [Claviceps sorghi]|nr:hypothetical protein E4U53_007133 [Claviceps sorghi]
MSDEVSQFLEQVERLRGQQIEDDAARAREREEFLAAKRERQARREGKLSKRVAMFLEMAISGTKSSPVNTPSPRSSRQNVQAFDAARFGSPSGMRQDCEPSDTPSLDPDELISSLSLSNQDKRVLAQAETAQTENSTPPARTPALSWQRRPASRGGVRPLSMVAAENATQKSRIEMQGPASATEESFSKDQIAKALGSKDASWFRQTADRGQGSAAYKRMQVEDEDRSDLSSASAQLPGLTAAGAPLDNDSRPRLDPDEPHHAKLASPVSFKPAPIEGAAEDIHRAQEFSARSATASPSRSPSPTKGLGGFVQSAMMKRSDSVKRWSVTSPAGLTRADSIAAARAYDRSSIQAGPRQHNTTRESSTTPTSSRPTSRQGDKPPALKLSSKDSASTERDEENPSTPTSAFKPTDTRRWSPTKSSWIESALNKPESPKPVTTPTQSTWREKAAMESNRPTSISHKHQVSIGGLLRQSALGTVAKSNPTGLGGIYSPPPNANRPAYGHGSKPSISQKGPDLEASQNNGQNSDAGMQSGRPTNRIDQSTDAETVKPTPTMSPPPLQSKPQTPPLKDLRSNLRQRTAEKEAPKSDEPEFKNVFGNLRRTKTQNFVAPDELKDNILRGRARLNSTDGPKRSEIKDEFKDAILRKKADFKTVQVEGRGVTRTTSNASDKPIPEGIARRANLGSRSSATASKRTSLTESPKAESAKPSPGPTNVPNGSAFSPISPNATRPSPLVTNPSTEKVTRVSTTESQAVKIKADGGQTSPGLPKEIGAPQKLSTQGRSSAGSGKLADRCNPALAGLLAKGPPGLSTKGVRDADGSDEQVSSKAGMSTETSASATQLTHMTKNRARGPKRKAPTSSKTASTVSPHHVEKPSTSTTTLEVAPLTIGSQREVPAGRPRAEITDASAVSTIQGKSASPSVEDQVASEANLRSDLPSSRSLRSAEPTQSSDPATHVRPMSRGRPQSTGQRASTPTSPLKTGPHSERDGTPSTSPKKLDVKRMSRFFDGASAHTVEQELSREPRSQRPGSRSPTKLAEPPSPAKSDRDSLPSMRDAPPRLDLRSSPTATKPSSDEPTTPSGFTGRSRPSSGLPAEGLESCMALASPVKTPAKQANEVSAILSDFFGPRQTRQAMRFDPAQILTKRPETSGKITSLGLQVFRISEDGRKFPVSRQSEHVLFDQEMYVCAHQFANQSGKKAFEIYFWVGDEVPESSAEDAHFFVQREAQALGGRLVKLRQGKETAEFVQAVGGVIMVRKGSSNKYDSLAPYMLCGRRYLGQVAFDQVDYSPSSLCAGFTYLISKGGNCYMWKGKGSDVTETSCARLVGMDLTLTGELTEFEDGNEPSSFWDLFEDKKSCKPHSADHWRLKPSYEQYCSRLFCSDADSRLQIFEISPFSQADLSSASIYILDAFFEMYIIVGSRANSQYSSFRNALDFAQEYAILASGMEDRPFVPISTVVLEGIPRDMKRVFRKWDDKKSPTVTKPAGSGSGSGLKRGRSLRVVTLTQALEALSD